MLVVKFIMTSDPLVMVTHCYKIALALLYNAEIYMKLTMGEEASCRFSYCLFNKGTSYVGKTSAKRLSNYRMN